MTKTILITGSTDGIGKLAAIKLAKDGHKIYLHGRKVNKLSKVIAEVKELSNNEDIKGFVCDFSDLGAVKKMALQINSEVPKIDILINNAGVYKSSIQQNKEGYDLRFVVNYFAPYLLTKEIFSILQRGNKPRIINLSSAAQAPVSTDVLLGKKFVPTQAAYAQSKLALTMWSFHLAKEVSNINVIALNPGSLLDTNMVREGFGRIWSTADKGGNIIYDLAVSEEYDGDTGKYFDNDKGVEKGSFGDAHSDAYDDTSIKQLIKITDKILNNQF